MNVDSGVVIALAMLAGAGLSWVLAAAVLLIAAARKKRSTRTFAEKLVAAMADKKESIKPSEVSHLRSVYRQSPRKMEGEDE